MRLVNKELRDVVLSCVPFLCKKESEVISPALNVFTTE